MSDLQGSVLPTLGRFSSQALHPLTELSTWTRFSQRRCCAHVRARVQRRRGVGEHVAPHALQQVVDHECKLGIHQTRAANRAKHLRLRLRVGEAVVLGLDRDLRRRPTALGHTAHSATNEETPHSLWECGVAGDHAVPGKLKLRDGCHLVKRVWARQAGVGSSRAPMGRASQLPRTPRSTGGRARGGRPPSLAERCRGESCSPLAPPARSASPGSLVLLAEVRAVTAVTHRVARLRVRDTGVR